MDKLIDFHLHYRLVPLEIKIFDTPEQIKQKTEWLSIINSSGVVSFKFPKQEDGIDSILINYRGFKLFFIPIE